MCEERRAFEMEKEEMEKMGKAYIQETTDIQKMSLSKEADMMMQKTHAQRQQQRDQSKWPLQPVLSTCQTIHPPASFAFGPAAMNTATAAAPRDANIKDAQRNRHNPMSLHKHSINYLLLSYKCHHSTLTFIHTVCICYE